MAAATLMGMTAHGFHSSWKSWKSPGVVFEFTKSGQRLWDTKKKKSSKTLNSYKRKYLKMVSLIYCEH